MPELGLVPRLSVKPEDRSAPVPESSSVPAFLRAQWAEVFAAVPAWEDRLHALENAIAKHGDSIRWLQALADLPALTATNYRLGDRVRIGRDADVSATDRAALRSALQALRPWRKGPFDVFGEAIDTEWRSDWKWQRIEPWIGSLEGMRILDVGCGNGYYGWRMRAAGASLVVGVDPTVLFLMQHLAICHYLPPAERLANCILPVRLEDLPSAPEAFDAIFSMGVLYHRREPLGHLAMLRPLLRSGGTLVIETLILPDDDAGVLHPASLPGGRYARMRNVQAIPGQSLLLEWLGEAGFRNARIVDVTATTTAEQRRTAWMPFESLAESLDPDDPTLTVEGHPAPVRAVVIASA